MADRNDPCPCGSGKKYKKCCMDETHGAHVNARGAGAASRLLMQAVAVHQAGNLDAAQSLYRKLLEAEPENADALHYLGLTFHQRGDADEACRLIEQAVQINDRVPAFFCNLGNAYKQSKKFDQAIAAYQKAIALDPAFAVAYYNLGTIHRMLGHHGPAAQAFERAVALDPRLAQAWLGLGDAHWDSEAIDAAESCYSRAIVSRADYAEAYLKRGTVRLRFGQADKALADFERAATLDPGNYAAQASRLITLNYIGTDARQIADAHRNWGRQLEASIAPLPARGDQGARIRIGYVSGDLRQHALRFFAAPILEHHDRDRFHIHCYYTWPNHDEHTERLKAHVETWRDCPALNHAELAAQIRADGIDILVDLSGHTMTGQLPAFAYKPAPVQASMLGYLNTSGLTRMDYRITDNVACPPGMFDDLHSESIARLPACQWCYRPDDHAPAVNALPAARNGYVTFGAFHNLAKVTPAMLVLWARLLSRMPQARLHMVVWGKTPARAVREFFAKHGVEQRVEILDPLPHKEYLRLYHEVDLVLDTFPYSGGTTAFESLWMGVPYVTLAGNTVTSRGGASILHHLDLMQFIASDPDDYIERAVSATADLALLSHTRQSLRQRMRQSALMAEVAYVRALEDLYRQFLDEAAGAPAGALPR